MRGDLRAGSRRDPQVAVADSAGQADALDRYYADFKELHGVRPTAVEVYQDGYNPRAVRERAGSWARFVGTQGDLDESQRQALDAHGAFIDALDTTEMVKSYKMLVLLAMLNANAFPGSIGIDALADEVERLATRTTKAGADLGAALGDRRRSSGCWSRTRSPHGPAARGTAGVSYFAYEDRTFRTTMNVEPGAVAGLQELVRELAEWRLTEYLDRAQAQTGGFSTLKVSHANGKPILFLPPEPERSDLPAGWTDVQIDGQPYSANFVKVAVNVVRRSGQEDNELPRILRGWFGPDAGAPGTRHTVALEKRGAEWHLRPLGQRPASSSSGARIRGKRFRPCSAWSSRPRSGTSASSSAPATSSCWSRWTRPAMPTDFQYKDHFISPTEFEWQSQNRTGQASADGQDIQKHAARGIAVHLFVRSQKKRAGGGAAPFVYCGDVEFVGWRGEKPITVQWRSAWSRSATCSSSTRRRSGQSRPN